SISRGLPSLGSMPDVASSLPDLSPPSLPDAGSVADQLPTPPSLPSLSAPAMPDLGAAARGLVGNLPALPPMGGLTPPAMPLAEGLVGAAQAAGQQAADAAGGALAAGQSALGSITGVGPSGAEAPAAPALPNLDKLTEHIWKEVQRKLKVERERSRGL